MIQEFSQIYQNNLLTLCIHLWIDLEKKNGRNGQKKNKGTRIPPLIK